MISRILTIGLLCAGLYAAALGAGAGAQEETPTPTPTATTAPAVQAPEATVSTEPTATTEPTETPAVETATPAPAETAPAPTQTADPTATPDSEPAATPSADPPTATSDAAPAAPAATAAPDATPGAVQKGARTLPRERTRVHAPNVEADTGCLSSEKRTKGTKHSTSTSGRHCAPVEREASHDRDRDHGHHAHAPVPTPKLTRPNGAPASSNPTFSLATPGAAPIGVPNFFIDKFRIPPFLLSIYQAAGIQYGVRWEVLAAINEIETDYGRNLNVSYAGALGWMQFMPATWEAYGTDANKDGVKDPYNPVDAIFAAARYLRAAGAENDLRKAIFAYNHADWYVDSVLMRARIIGGLPSNFVGSLTGLTQGRFPVRAKATYAGKLRKSRQRGRKGANAAFVVEGNGRRRGIEIFARAGAPVIAVNDGRVVRIGENKRLGRFIQLQDVYGNTFTYAKLKKVVSTYPAPKRRSVSRAQIRREMALPKPDRKPSAAASATRKGQAAKAAARGAGTATAAARREAATAARAGGPRPALERRRAAAPAKERLRARGATAEVLPAARPAKQRLFANPQRPRAFEAGGDLQLEAVGYEPSFAGGMTVDPRDFEPKRMRKGARVIAGTILGRVGRSSAKRAPHLLFEIRPAGRGAPRIDPKPILDGWKLLESTAIYRAAGKNPFYGADAETPSIGQILLMSKEALMRHVLANPRIDVYGCGEKDIATGQIDRRVLATLEFLAASGLKPTVTSLKCGHGFYTASGNVSHHSSGNAVDIAAINGVTINPATQGKGSVTDLTIQRLLTLQGTMKPDQIISLMKFDGADNTFAMGDHDDHIHVGWRPLYGTNSKASKQVNAVLKPSQWIKLIDRLGHIDNPTVREAPSKYAVKVVKRASRAHHGE